MRVNPMPKTFARDHMALTREEAQEVVDECCKMFGVATAAVIERELDGIRCWCDPFSGVALGRCAEGKDGAK